MVPKSLYDLKFSVTSHFCLGWGCYSTLRWTKEGQNLSLAFEVQHQEVFSTYWPGDSTHPNLYGGETIPSSLSLWTPSRRWERHLLCPTWYIAIGPTRQNLPTQACSVGRIQHKHEILIVQRNISVLSTTCHIGDQENSGEGAGFSTLQHNRAMVVGRVKSIQYKIRKLWPLQAKLGLDLAHYPKLSMAALLGMHEWMETFFF